MLNYYRSEVGQRMLASSEVRREWHFNLRLKEKHDALMRLKEGKVTTECPATFLLLHPNVIVLCDEAAEKGI